MSCYLHKQSTNNQIKAAPLVLVSRVLIIVRNPLFSTSVLLFIMSPLPSLLHAFLRIGDLPSSLPSISMWLWKGWSPPSSSWSFTPRALAPHPAVWETICDPTAGPNKRGPCRFTSTTHFLQRLCRLFYYGDDGYEGVLCWFIGKTDRLLLQHSVDVHTWAAAVPAVFVLNLFGRLSRRGLMWLSVSPTASSGRRVVLTPRVSWKIWVNEVSASDALIYVKETNDLYLEFEYWWFF